MQRNTKEWIQYGSAIVVLTSGIVLAYVSYFTSRMRDVTDNVLWYFAQTLMYAGSIFGVAIAIDAKFENIKNKFLNHKNNFTQYLLDTGVPSEYTLDIFKHMLFRTEGHEVNNRIYFPTAVKVMKNCSEQVLSFKAHNKKVSFSALQSILLEELPKFNQYRIDTFAKKNTFKF